MMRKLGWILVALFLVSLCAGTAFAEPKSDKDKLREKLIKELDKRLDKIRKEMVDMIDKALGTKEKPVPAVKGGKPYLGIRVRSVPDGLRVMLDLKEGEGLLVAVQAEQMLLGASRIRLPLGGEPFEQFGNAQPLFG